MFSSTCCSQPTIRSLVELELRPEPASCVHIPQPQSARAILPGACPQVPLPGQKDSPSSLCHFILFVVCSLVYGLPPHQIFISREPGLECGFAHKALCLTLRGHSVSVCRVSG